MLGQRILTAIVALVVVAIALFVLPQWATRAIVALLMLIAAWEWSGLLRLNTTLLRLSFVGLVIALMSGVMLLLPSGLQIERVSEVALAWWIVAFAWLFFHPTPIPAPLAWLCGALVIVPAWYAIDWLYRYSSEALLMVLLIVIAADTGAYFAGRFFGRVKLAPSISPGKTWEGAIGGMALVSVLATVVALQTGQGIAVLVPVFLAIGVLSIVGDLTVSVFKRHAGVKDSGRLFPGHGGVLDRIDSIAAAAPAFAMAMTLGVIA
jgi:phosphatidate cytidylyltransferase